MTKHQQLLHYTPCSVEAAHVGVVQSIYTGQSVSSDVPWKEETYLLKPYLRCYITWGSTPRGQDIITLMIMYQKLDSVILMMKLRIRFEGTINATFCSALNPKSDTLRFPLLSRSRFSGYNSMPRFIDVSTLHCRETKQVDLNIP